MAGGLATAGLPLRRTQSAERAREGNTMTNNRRDTIRVKPTTEGAEIQTLSDGRTVHILRRADLMEQERAKRRTWQHGHVGIHWFVSTGGTTIAAHETDQPTAPRSMHVRTCDGKIVVSIGSYSRKELDDVKFFESNIIEEAAAEARTLTERGYKIGDTKSRTWYDAACSAHPPTRPIGDLTREVVEARLLYGIPLDTAVRHVLRPLGRIGTPQERSLRRQAQRRIATLRNFEGS